MLSIPKILLIIEILVYSWAYMCNYIFVKQKSIRANTTDS